MQKYYGRGIKHSSAAARREGDCIMKLQKKAALSALVLVLVATSLVFSSCSQSGGKIIMGTNAAFEPFEYRNENNEVEGFDVDFAKKIAEKLGKELVIEDVTFQSLFTLLESGKIDFIAAGCTITEERQKSADFSDSYFNAKQMVLVMADDESIQSQDDLSGKRIGVQIGTTGDTIASDIQAENSSTQVVSFNAAYAAIMDMQNGKLDAVIIDNEPAKKFSSVNDQIKILDVGFDDEFYAVAVSKGNTELLKTINEVLQELRDSGEYDQMIDKYFK